jgi:hypothetical protein
VLWASALSGDQRMSGDVVDMLEIVEYSEKRHQNPKKTTRQWVVVQKATSIYLARGRRIFQIFLARWQNSASR